MERPLLGLASCPLSRDCMGWRTWPYVAPPPAFRGVPGVMG
nr:MAG TPA: hypothetical protein [Caudoviricetes sp.]